MPGEANAPQPADAVTDPRARRAPEAPARSAPSSPPPARIVLALLGTPGVTMDGRPLTCGSRKALALLAFVALEGRATRARLAALFWPDLDVATSARRNLRRELHRPRGAGLKAVLEENGDVLACMTLPKAHRQPIHSTTPLERLNAEGKGRTDVVGIFPNAAAIVRLAGRCCWSTTTSGKPSAASCRMKGCSDWPTINPLGYRP